MKEKWNKFWHGDKGTKCRMILLVLSWANQLIAMIGQTSFAQAAWYQIATVIITALVSGVTAWENNDFTYFAKLGTRVLDALEDKKLTKEEVLKILGEDEKTK